MIIIRNICLVFGATALAGLVHGSPIAISNASFENPVQAPGAFTTGVITDWTVAPGLSGVWDPSGPYTGSLGPVPDGKQVGYINSGSISQTLSSFLAPGTKYTLSIEVGGRTDGIGNPGTGYAVELLSGTTVIASVTPTSPPIGSWSLASGEYTSPGVVLSEQLSVRISLSGAQQFDFDNIRLDAALVSGVPEGGSLGLLVFTSALGLVSFKQFVRARS